MIFTQFNIITIFIFIILFLISIIFCYFNFRKINNNNLLSKNIKKNKKIFTFFITFILLFISVNIFGIKGNFTNSDNNFTKSNILFLLDVSKSMNVEDVFLNGEKASRLQLSKEYITDFINKYPNNNYALSIFAGESLKIIPFTTDINIFITLLTGVDENNLSKYGTNFDIALNDSITSFKQNNKDGLIVILSDIGEDDNFSKLSALPSDLKAFIIGVGTERGGFILLGENDIGKKIYKIYNSKRVVSKLITENLHSLGDSLKSNFIILDNSILFDKINIELSSEISSFININFFDNKYDYSRLFISFGLILFIVSLFYLGRKK